MVDANMRSGIPKFKRNMFRLSLRAASLEGAMYIYLPGSPVQKDFIVSVSLVVRVPTGSRGRCYT